uniref:TIL domain-containing protein n=1 Tax=Angiostrongylus cantonensis TaxID=6313 RepID=A0A0K0D967_ANGCA
MMKLILLITIITLSVFASDPNDPFKCDKNGKCPPGSRCEDGTCYGRPDCPQVMMPRMKSGCKMILVPDERDCPMPKIICNKENRRCGDVYCERGYFCNPDTTTCVLRWDCPPVRKVPSDDKCTKLVLDDDDCFVPVNICEESKSIRQKRSADTKTSKNNWLVV